MSKEQEDLDLITRLKKHPKLFARMEGLLEVVENAGGDIKKAAAAELRVIEEVRQMGHEVLQSWAMGEVEKASIDANKKEGIRSAGKKNLSGRAPSERLK